MSSLKPSWKVHAVIADHVDIPASTAQNLVDLFEAENTIPFIARYRKHLTNNMEVDMIRKVKNELDNLKSVAAKMNSSFVAIEKAGKMTEEIKTALQSSYTVEQLEHIYAPFKPGSKRTLAARARDIGLEDLAMSVVVNPQKVPEHKFHAFARESQDVDTVEDAQLGCQHIIADYISKHKDIMGEVWKTVSRYPSRIETHHLAPTKVKAKVSAKPVSTKAPTTTKGDSYKYERYFDFSACTKSIQPHQVLAINRGEKQKILSVKVTVHSNIHDMYKHTCRRILLSNAMTKFHLDLVERSMDDAFSRLIQPMLVRHIRSALQKMAHSASIDVFASNLRRLLLTPPVRGKIVLGLDPGFTHGCKCAVISETGKILHTDVIYLHAAKMNVHLEHRKLIGIVSEYRSETVAIGNGTGCRETESVVSDMIKQRAFGELNVVYCIVSENGASIYSVSEQAQKEMPDLDPSYRGAVSIARRLQDPLAELVKIEPKHLGIGMYQHDLNETSLISSLNEIIEECVSFVGVDVNSCSECLLKHVSGLTAARAKSIIEWREKNGQFRNREDLKLVKGIGEKSYQQCIGFVRVTFSTNLDTDTQVHSEITAEIKVEDAKSKKSGQKRKALSVKSTSKKAKVASSEIEPLDRTSIHPESYEKARLFLNQISVDSREIGHQVVISRVKTFMNSTSLDKVSLDVGTDIHTMKLIIDGLMQPLGEDCRANFEKPLFKKSIVSINDISFGTVLTGRVVNVTHFGAFVDIGVGNDSLLHNSRMRPNCMNGKSSLELGDRVEVRVCTIDRAKFRIGVELVKLW